MTAAPDVAGSSVLELAGHNRISTQALTSVAQAAAAQTLGVSASDVRASWADDAGLLALSLALPIGIPPLGEVARDPRRVERTGGSVLDRAVAAKATILALVQELTGSRLSRVDIRITGIRTTRGGRVL
ncbi:hypothetical protein [Arthrobacter sp. 35W]|uniref:hypothetical protein n=1 Tax=Arthrobacter sp. 35W TaxID=1132441 RepID=UPI0004173B57|nr:hypothetical protein [Arthrobacter sp. 35W]